MSKFKTIAVVSFPAEAVVIKSKLESEHVTVILKDEFTVATDPFATNALGGVKLHVYKEDYIKAMGLLEQYAPELVQHSITHARCPNCGMRDVRDPQDINAARNFSETLKAIWLSLFPLTRAHTYHCNSCGHKFDIDS